MSDEELAKDLGPLAALTIGVGTMIGAGIFVLPGDAAGKAGPVVAVSFVVGGIISLFTALSASELGTAMPKAGGSYYYVNHGLGPLFGSIAGMGNWMGLAFASAFYMLGFGNFITAMLDVPSVGLLVLTLDPNQVAALVAGATFVGVNYVGAKETGRLQNIIVLTLVGILTVFTVAGLFSADLSTLSPYAPKGAGAILPGTALVFVSFLGFAKITTVAEEIKNPGRNLPLAVVGSVVIVTIMYAIIMVVLMAVKKWDELAASSTPVIDVAEIAFGNAGGRVDWGLIADPPVRTVVETLFGSPVGPAAVGGAAILFAGLLATGSSANASILASSRINFAMGRDKLVTGWLNEVHPKFATPYRSIAITGAFILLFIAFGKVKTLAKAGSVLHLIVYGLLNLSLIVMREADVPEYDPDFEVPLYPVVPILGAVTSFGLIAFMDPIEIGLSLGFVGFGVAWYLLYARSRADKQGILGQYILRRSDSLPDSAVSAADAVQPDGGSYRVMVPLANPEHETELIELAAAIAKQRGGTVDAVHIVTVPDQTTLEYGAEHVEEIDPGTEQILKDARRDAETLGVPVETHTILSHRSFEEVFDAARDHDADVVVLGWGEGLHGPGRVEGEFDELTDEVPCDFLVLKDRGFDPSRILVPTAGGPDSDLSAEVAAMLRSEYGGSITLLHVADDADEGREFLEAWAESHGLEDATLRVETGDVETEIERAAADASMVVVGATERGLLSRLVSGSLVMDVVDDVDCSVLLAERPRDRSLLERLLGSGGD